MSGLYHNFIGIDISKNDFVVAIHQQKATFSFANSKEGINKFISDLGNNLTQSLIILEATGGYEMLVLSSLTNAGFLVHRADARKVKNFIRSLGGHAKTDAIDAKLIAHYGAERHNRLEVYKLSKVAPIELKQLYARRSELSVMLVQEKNRLQSPSNEYIKVDILDAVISLTERIKKLDNRIDNLIETIVEYKEKKKVLMTVPGIGNKTANALMALLPELGSTDGKKMASLCGVAPHPRQSGKSNNYRRTYGGRRALKPVLFLAAMGARRSNSEFATFYHNLIARGKKGLVALTALMRKIIVVANARVRDYCTSADLLKI